MFSKRKAACFFSFFFVLVFAAYNLEKLKTRPTDPGHVQQFVETALQSNI